MTVTLGCQANFHDSEKIAGYLIQCGHTLTQELDEADLVIYNTCCVRENPERKLYGQVGGLKAWKREKPGRLIGVCGCMVQQSAELPVIIKRLSHVDLIFGTHNIHRLPELLKRCLAGERVIEVWDKSDGVYIHPTFREDKLKAWVDVIHGCNNFCTYCIVPYTRGRERSRPVEHIIDEVKQLADAGIKEITLLGQNVNSYGKNLVGQPSFADLLGALDDIPGICRIRFMTSHPKDCSPQLIKALGQLEKVCEHLHLPLQAGSDRILKAMNRRYTRAYYLELVERIRSEVPQISLTTDLMVGFPGEDEEDFADTLSAVEQIRFDSAFTFIYSPRKNTKAAAMKGQVPDEVKSDRISRLIEVQNQISFEKNQKLIGTRQTVLVEGTSKDDAKKLSGRTRTNKLVLFPGDQNLWGQEVVIKVVGAGTWHLEGALEEAD
ncbi:MAG: tRNA (N6-isopentenyl adenosine(37)-C2)-methylthiotransferase MiaB [Limnochordia bacterium]|jgi:tRNA-2-methylthio-N6-dimethylallyladenosine synthase